MNPQKARELFKSSYSGPAQRGKKSLTNPRPQGSKVFKQKRSERSLKRRRETPNSKSSRKTLTTAYSKHQGDSTSFKALYPRKKGRPTSGVLHRREEKAGQSNDHQEKFYPY